ncbi:MAG: alpha-ketoglutarate-dependent dioxygenase AlkB, partial [Pseudomonadota bacterium]
EAPQLSARFRLSYALLADALYVHAGQFRRACRGKSWDIQAFDLAENPVPRWDQFEPRRSCAVKANGQPLRNRGVEPEDWLGPLPTAFRFIILRIMPEELFQVEPNQIIVNEYLPGQGIAPHIDCLPCFAETIISLSLGSSCMMDFSKEGIQHKEHVVLEPRDLLILTGPARSTWRHGIAARKSDLINGVRRPRSRRVSLTLRVVEQ